PPVCLLTGGNGTEPRDAPHADPVTALAGSEADVGLAPKSALDNGAVDLVGPPLVVAAALAVRRIGGRVGAQPDDLVVVEIGHGRGARSANFAKRRKNESLTMSVGPFRCFARWTSARPCWSDSSPL